MRFRSLAAFLFASVFLVNSAILAQASHYYYLPQVANGYYGGGIYKTKFVVFNNTNTPTTVTIDLTDNNGNPLTMTIGAETNSSFTFDLPAGASRMLETDGQGNLAVGAAKVTSTAADIAMQSCRRDSNLQGQSAVQGLANPSSRPQEPVFTQEPWTNRANIQLHFAAGLIISASRSLRTDCRRLWITSRSPRPWKARSRSPATRHAI